MALTQTRLAGPARVTDTANAVIYTCPASTTVVVKQITLCNTHSGAVTVTLSLKPAADSIGNQHKIFSAVSLNASETLSISGSYVLTASDTINGSASVTNVVNIVMNGLVEA